MVTLSVSAAQSGEIAPRQGWDVHATSKSYQTLLKDTLAAVRANKMGVVTQAGPTAAAAARGITIPGNRVIGVFNNDFAVRILATSTAAMIEAPIRLYVTEAPDGSATLSYKRPSHVFAPYHDEGGDALMELAKDLDRRFKKIAIEAVN
ncbi:MAG: DUF302 domain-containing protein [Pseudophaeobacter sp. bin_em_oilr2.035]|nr:MULTISPECIES: DUF302 domain-containing protein [Phaeobacter]MDF1771128.1 DUF302 domain-containing protein [Pseudophaeobacter sp. bin_em_oilr2.035]MEE2635371.1 DUF302 domain-containing protein [Pseudomonadota bacterium]MDE4062003.1 DUF302 domain-containing protein [Phaeobacter gallaeciensis]MDE4125050.1 DUF302 domain-containing protein [Phaeobacter gallaeciensis]MDE4129522.1 DUF302 domain-containing protein [Phaeobacter gallaeciensis]